MKTPNTQKPSSKPSRSRQSEGSPYSAPAVEKTLDILEFLGDAPQGMSLTGIAEGLGRTKQELFRVLICLQERGYLIRDEKQYYRLSTKLFEVGARHASSQTLVARATPHMQRLATLVKHTCHLSVVVQNRMMVVARFDSDADVFLTVRIGVTFQMRSTSGQVALTFLPDQVRQEYWDQSGESPERIRELEALHALIREQGYAILNSPSSQGVTDCATPILGSGSTLLGVLCVSHIRLHEESSTSPEVIEAVLDCARNISREFGPDPKVGETIRRVKSRGDSDAV